MTLKSPSEIKNDAAARFDTNVPGSITPDMVLDSFTDVADSFVSKNTAAAGDIQTALDAFADSLPTDSAGLTADDWWLDDHALVRGPHEVAPPAATYPLSYQGTWNANTNVTTPIGGGSGSLASSVGSTGDVWKVSVAGVTNLNGINSWLAGDYVFYNGTVWGKMQGPTIPQIPSNNVTGLAASATTDTTNAANISSGTLNADRLPAIAANNVSGLAASATVDATNADNINAGTLAAARLPSGARVLLQTLTASNSASLQWSGFDSGYKDYELVITNLVPVTNAAMMYLRMIIGAAVIDTGYVGYTALRNSIGTSFTASTGVVDLSGGQRTSNSANFGISGKVSLLDVNNNSRNKSAIGQCMIYDSNAAVVTQLDITSYLVNTGVVQGFVVAADNGNLSTGIIRVYGTKA